MSKTMGREINTNLIFRQEKIYDKKEYANEKRGMRFDQFLGGGDEKRRKEVLKGFSG